MGTPVIATGRHGKRGRPRKVDKAAAILGAGGQRAEDDHPGMTLAKAAANPADFAELILWPRFVDGVDRGETLYAKQRQFLEVCASELGKSFGNTNDGGRRPGPPGRVALMAANGGGKTARCLPALVIWLFHIWPLAKIKITSGAWTQVETQIWPALEQFRARFTQTSPGDGFSYAWKWYETPYIEVAQFKGNAPSGRKGFLACITTNDPGRAEGDHGELPDQPLIWIVDEAKTSAQWLKKVLVGRIRPQLLVLMSSPGHEDGWFYEAMRKDDSYRRVELWAEDCSHISPDEIKQIKDDWKDFPAFAESILGHEFMPLVEDSVINGPALDECIANPPKREETGDVHAFCDFAWSSGGAENTMALRRGNVITLPVAFHNDHLVASPKNPTPGVCETFIAHWQRLGLEAHQISGDEGGGGKLVMDALDTMGWCLTRVNNDGVPSNERYGSTGSEIWYEGSKQITARTVVLDIDQKTRGQMLNRKRVTKAGKEKLYIESKPDMAKRGVQSPDRADAVFGAMMPHGGFSSGLIKAAVAVNASKESPGWQNTALSARQPWDRLGAPEGDVIDVFASVSREPSRYELLMLAEKSGGLPSQ